MFVWVGKTQLVLLKWPAQKGGGWLLDLLRALGFCLPLGCSELFEMVTLFVCFLLLRSMSFLWISDFSLTTQYSLYIFLYGFNL